MTMFEPILLLVILLFYTVYCALTRKQDYWKKKNVPFVKPTLLFGNYQEHILLKQSAAHIASDICKKYPKEPYIGTFYGTEPALIVQDLEIIKQILTKDFYYFNGREISNYTHKEKLGNSLNFLGGDHWKVIRSNLTPLFSPTKIKNMFPLINDSAKQFEEFLKVKAKMSRNINVQSALRKFTMSCIISCAFGVDAKTMAVNADDNLFISMGDKMFDSATSYKLRLICRSMWPTVFYGLGFKLFDNHIYTFFKDLFGKVSKSRQEVKSNRNDFVDLILEWGTKSHISCDSLSNCKTGEKKLFKIPVDNDLLVAQSIAIFGAGFETTSITLTFLLYELSKNELKRERLIQEFDSYIHRHNGVIEYECVNEMPYLEACIDETLRLYPAIGILTREVMDDCTLRSGLHLEKGMRIHIPTYHINRDPRHFPEPEAFIPERFLDDERKNIKPFSFIPFGEGPRICIGQRFAKMPMFAGLITIYKNYTVELAENTPRIIEYNPCAIVTQPTSDVYLQFSPRHI